MGLFSRKKEKAKPQVLNVSGEQLCVLLKKAIELAEEDVNANCYSSGPEVMIEHGDNIHFIGIKYDKKRAKLEDRHIFSEELMSVYIDKSVYKTVAELYANADVDGTPLNAISEGIIISPDYKELLQ